MSGYLSEVLNRMTTTATTQTLSGTETDEAVSPQSGQGARVTRGARGTRVTVGAGCSIVADWGGLSAARQCTWMQPLQVSACIHRPGRRGAAIRAPNVRAALMLIRGTGGGSGGTNHMHLFRHGSGVGKSREDEFPEGESLQNGMMSFACYGLACRG